MSWRETLNLSRQHSDQSCWSIRINFTVSFLGTRYVFYQSLYSPTLVSVVLSNSLTSLFLCNSCVVNLFGDISAPSQIALWNLMLGYLIHIIVIGLLCGGLHLGHNLPWRDRWLYIAVYHSLDRLTTFWSHFLCWRFSLQVSHIDCVTREEAHDFVEDDQTHGWNTSLLILYNLSVNKRHSLCTYIHTNKYAGIWSHF